MMVLEITLTISGNLDLDGAATSLTTLTVEGASNLGANVTTSGTQIYTGAVTLSGAARTLTTAGSAVTFSNTVNGAQDLTVDTTNSGGSSAATVQFGGVVGGTTPVGAIIITGNLDLNAIFYNLIILQEQPQLMFQEHQI
jgi:hypothetical protein